VLLHDSNGVHHRGHQVSIVNPARIKGYGKSQLSRTKNDAAEANLIARFCRDLKPTGRRIILIW
jgi:transposase